MPETLPHAGAPAPGATADAAASDTPKNIVLICADQWRGDCLGAHDHPVVHTPFIDQLATSGVDCTNAYVANPTCVPARVSLITGLSAQNHRRVGYQDGVPFDIENTLPAVLSAAGYQTQAVGKMHYFPDRARCGFDNVILHDGYLHSERKGRRDVRFYDDYSAWLQQHTDTAVDYIDNGLECNSLIARPWDKDERLHPTNWVTEQSIEWLYRRDPTAPFFLYVSYHRPHAPYDPPQWAWDLFHTMPEEELVELEECDWYPHFEQWYQHHDPAALVTDPGMTQRRRALAGYYASMAHIDLQVSRLRQALYEFDVLDNTLVVFTSDHGDMMGQYNLWRKGFPYEGSARVPLILSGGGVDTRTEERLIEIRDLMPTLLDYAGVDIPPEVEGRSFLCPAQPQAEDTAPQAKDTAPQPWREQLHGEHYLFGQSIQWIRWQDYKYIWFSQDGYEQLFNLKKDPRESHNLLTPEPAAWSEQTRQARNHGRNLLITHLTGREEGFVANGALVAGREATCLLSRSTPLPPQLQ